MRNLKKILALVLSLMMVLSVMVTASATDFADDADITNKEAVEVMSALGILSGSQGKFAPKGTLERAQAAKIIAFIKLGADADALLKGTGSTKFEDVTSGWAYDYISYCAGEGIVSGSQGKFFPKNTLTGYEFGKMVLNAAGVEGTYTGSQWKINVATALKKANLLTGLDGLVLSANLTREQAAQLAFNAMNYTATGNTTGKYVLNSLTSKTTALDGQVFESRTEAILVANAVNSSAVLGTDYTLTAQTDNSGSIADLVYGLKVEDGVVTANQATGAAYTTIGAANYNFKTGTDLIGHHVTVYYASTYTSAAKPGKTYAVIDNSTTFEMNALTTLKDLNAALGKPEATAFSGTYTKYDGAYAASSVSTTPVGQTGTAVIYNNAVIAFVEPTSYTLSKVTGITTTAGAETITLGGTIGELQNNATSDVVVEYAGIAKDDYVVVYQVGSIYHLSKVTTVTGTPSKIKDDTVTIGGVTYNKKGTDNGSGLSPVAASAMSFTGEYTLYLDGEGNYITATAKATTVDTSVVYVVAGYTITTPATTDDFGSVIPESHAYYVQAVDMAGNQVIYQSASSQDSITAGLYKVSTSYDTTLKATVATFTSAASTTASSVDLAASAVKIAANHYFTSDVQFIYVTGTKADLKVVVKSGVQALSGKNVEYVAEQVGATTNYTVKYVVVKDAYEAPVVTGKDVMFAAEAAASTTKVPYTDAAGAVRTGWQHTVYIDGVKTEIITTDAAALSGFKTYTVAGSLYTITGDNSAANLKAATTVANMYNGLISTNAIGGVANSAVTDLSVADATVVNLTSNTKVPSDPTALTTADTVALVLNANGTAVVTVYVVSTTRT